MSGFDPSSFKRVFGAPIAFSMPEVSTFSERFDDIVRDAAMRLGDIEESALRQGLINLGWLPPGTVNREIAHAVAAEREAIAAWLTSPASDDAWADMSDTGMADAIRNGAHNEKPATSSP